MFCKDKVMKNKVLIIKLGYSETFDKEISRISSLGDVLRSTVVLHLFKNDDVAWLTDEKAAPLLYQNPFINRVLRYDFTTVLQVQNEIFDVVINLEKVPGICAMADNIKAWKRYGFRFNPLTGISDYYMFSEKAMEIVTNESTKKTHGMTWQGRLFEMLGEEWRGEDYILGYQSLSTEQYDIGFNYQVGGKWPTKAWGMNNWERLEELCHKEGFSVSWQEGMDNLYDYIDWINKNRLIISNDSLGLHMAFALKKKVIGLFGTTGEKEVYFYSQGTPIIPNGNLSCRPCYNPTCIYDTECINTITPETVIEHIKDHVLNKV